jgi:hypothetical protein
MDISTWPQRYIFSSFELNYILVNNKRLIPRNGKHWSIKDVKLFITWLYNNSNVLTKTKIVYRGTWDSSVPFWNLNNEIPINQNIVSTSSKKSIAKEFSNSLKGFLHILQLTPGCHIFDMKNHYNNSVASREKEILILPNHKFTLLNKNGHCLTWVVSPL